MVIQEPELHLGDFVAIADGSWAQGARGTVTEICGYGVLVQLESGEFYRIEWWKDAQLLKPVETP